MAQFILLGVCLLAGMAMRFWNRVPKEASVVLNGFIFHLSLPALIILQFHQVQLTHDAWYPVSMAWILLLISALVFFLLGKMLRWDKKTVGALILTGGLGNTSFVGLPMVEAFYGKDSLKVAVLADQLGTFLVLSTLGMAVASLFGARNFSVRQVFRRIFAFPPVYALIVAFALRPIEFPNFIVEALAKLGGTITPLALVSVGFQLTLKWSTLRSYFFKLKMGLLFKLVVAPALFTLLYVGLFHGEGDLVQVTIIESAMAPMITAAIVSSEYDLNSELANLMVGVGIPLSFLTVPLWVWFLRSVAA
jgi:predicted permease